MNISMKAFFDELEKIAAKHEDSGKWRRRALVGAAATGGALLAGAGLVAARPALRAHVLHDLKSIGRGGSHAVERARAVPEIVREQAKKIADLMRRQGINPKNHRIAISGTGGTGKSSLGRALADELGMRPLMLDDVGKSLSGRNLTKWVKKNPIRKGVIAEQTHLTNQVEPDRFDAIIRVHKPMKEVKKQILKRGRGAGQLEIYDYDKLHKTIETGVRRLDGKAHRPFEHVEIKFKPPGGFRADSHLNRELKRKGVPLDHPKLKTRHDKVYAATTGKVPKTPGIVPYIRTGRIAAGAGIVGAGGAAAGYEAHKATERK